MSEEAKAPPPSSAFNGWAIAFFLLAILPTLSTPIVLEKFVVSGFAGNISYGMFIVMAMTPVFILECLVYLRMITLSQTKLNRAVLILTGLILALDATLMLGWGMHASGC